MQLDSEKNSIFWKIFFFMTAALMVLAMLGMAVMEDSSLSFFDYIDFILSIISVFGLFGFAFYKSIGSIVFWRYFFYVVLIETIIYSLVFPIFGVEQYGQVFEINIWLLFQVIYTFFFLYAMHSYAYKCSFIWKKS